MVIDTRVRTGTPRRGVERANRRDDRAERFRRRSRAADLLITASWSSAAAAVALFLAGGGASDFGSPGATVTSLGIVAGLVGTDLVLVMLVLAARIPLIDRAVGLDRAMALHRTLGKPALYLLLAHAALLITGYGLAEGINPIAEVIGMFALPDLPLAFLGLVLLIGVVVTSLVAVRRRMRYEFWFVIHLLSYAAVLVAVPHQLSAGSILAEGTLSRVYWIALYVVALGSILGFRVVKPIVISLRHRIRVERVDPIAPGVASLHLSGRSLAALGAEGGQYFIWRFWTWSTWWHSHPISLSAVPVGDTARITVRAIGEGSTRLGFLPAGARVTIEGPYGIFTDAARTAPRLAIVAAGIGVTAVLALLEGSRLEPGEATVLLRASDPAETYLWEEMSALASDRGASFFTTVGPRGHGDAAWMAAADQRRGVTLTSVFPDLASSDLYVCGPQRWMDIIVDEAKAAGLPPHQIHAERFDW